MKVRLKDCVQDVYVSPCPRCGTAPTYDINGPLIIYCSECAANETDSSVCALGMDDLLESWEDWCEGYEPVEPRDESDLRRRFPAAIVVTTSDIGGYYDGIRQRTDHRARQMEQALAEGDMEAFAWLEQRRLEEGDTGD